MELRWVRSKDGALFGVCKGLAKALDLQVGWVRLFWLACIFLGGAGIGLYLLLAVTLPREDQIEKAYEPKILGVCAKLSRRLEMEVGLVRFATLCLFFGSLGLTAFLYILGYFVLPENQPNPAVASRNNPSSPPSTT